MNDGHAAENAKLKADLQAKDAAITTLTSQVQSKDSENQKLKDQAAGLMALICRISIQSSSSQLSRPRLMSFVARKVCCQRCCDAFILHQSASNCHHDHSFRGRDTETHSVRHCQRQFSTIGRCSLSLQCISGPQGA